MYICNTKRLTLIKKKKRNRFDKYINKCIENIKLNLNLFLVRFLPEQDVFLKPEQILKNHLLICLIALSSLILFN